MFVFVYSLHSSLSQKVNLRQHFNTTLEHAQLELSQKSEEVKELEGDKSRLLDQVRILAGEKKQLLQELKKSHDTINIDKNNLEKWE